MNTLDDLRATLERAADFRDPAAHARAAAVRDRVRAVRRRRASATALAAVVAVLAVVAGGVLLGGPDPVEPSRPSPRPDPSRSTGTEGVSDQVVVSGFPYARTRVVRPRGDDVVRIPEVSHQAAVLVASGLGDGTATLEVDGAPSARLLADGRTAPVLLSPDGAPTGIGVDVVDAPDATVRVELWDRTDQLADGVDNGSAVFRDRYGGLVRADAAFAEPGARGVDLTVTAPLSELHFSLYCTADSLDVVINVEIDGDTSSGTDCGGGGAADIGGLGMAALGGDPDATVHTVHAYLTRGGDPLADPTISYGIGAYVPAPGPTVRGVHTPRTLDFAGRTWTLDDVTTQQAADIATGDQDRLLRFVGPGAGATATFSGRLDPRQQTWAVTADAVASVVDGAILLPGDTYHVELSAPGAILVYRPE